jgi:hypothetical protein
MRFGYIHESNECLAQAWIIDDRGTAYAMTFLRSLGGDAVSLFLNVYWWQVFTWDASFHGPVFDSYDKLTEYHRNPDAACLASYCLQANLAIQCLRS